MSFLILMAVIFYLEYYSKQQAEKEKSEIMFITAKQQDEIDKKYRRFVTKVLAIVGGIYICILLLLFL